jgi:hypothetical protein
MTMYEILSLIMTGWDVSYDYGWDFCDVIDETMDLNCYVIVCEMFYVKICCAIVVDIFVMLWNVV